MLIQRRSRTPRSRKHIFA